MSFVSFKENKPTEEPWRGPREGFNEEYYDYSLHVQE